jgi:hypothetical protein
MEGGNAIDIADEAERTGSGTCVAPACEKVKDGRDQPRRNQQRHDRLMLERASLEHLLWEAQAHGSGSRLKATWINWSWSHQGVGQVAFTWEGTDKRGNKVKGKPSPPDEGAARRTAQAGRRPGAHPQAIQPVQG